MGADMILYRLPVDLTMMQAEARLAALTDREMYARLYEGDESVVWDERPGRSRFVPTVIPKGTVEA